MCCGQVQVGLALGRHVGQEQLFCLRMLLHGGARGGRWAGGGRVGRAGVGAEMAADEGLIRGGQGVVGKLGREGGVRKEG